MIYNLSPYKINYSSYNVSLVTAVKVKGKWQIFAWSPCFTFCKNYVCKNCVFWRCYYTKLQDHTCGTLI